MSSTSSTGLSMNSGFSYACACRTQPSYLTRIIRELTQKLHITGYGSQSKNMLFWVR